MAQNDRTTGLVGNSAFKVPCRAATTAAITLSGEQTIDGIACVTDDRVLVKDQASGVDNGIYVVDTGDWERAKDCDGSYDLVDGTVVGITDGTVSAGLFYQCSGTNPIDIGTDATTWAVVSPSSPILLPLAIAQGGTGTDSAVKALAALGVVSCTAVGGTANAITCTVDSTVTAYRTNQVFELTPAATNTGATTFTPTPSGAGALAGKNIFANGAACVGGELQANVPVLLLYDGTQLNIVGGNTGDKKAASVAAAATTNIWGGTQDLVHITGSGGPITSFGTAPYAGAKRTLIFDSTPTVVHNAASLQLPGGFNIVVEAGTRAEVRADTTGNMIVTWLTPNGATPGGELARMFISGLTYANNVADATNDIDIAAGSCRDATNAMDLVLAATLTKQSDVAWAVGSGNGGLDTGAVGNNDYYIWLIKRSDTGVVDALFSLSSTAPTMPASYDYKRLIGWFKRVGGTIVAFHTYETGGGGLEMNWDAPTLDVNLANTLTTARRTDAIKVPLAFSVIAHINVSAGDAATTNIWICCPDQTDAAPSGTVAPLANVFVPAGSAANEQLFIRTSATGTIAARANTATVDLYAVATMGFRWDRRN